MGSRGTKEQSRKISGFLLALMPRQHGHLDVIKRWEEYTGKKAERGGNYLS